jgi:hypothetical protein
VKISDGAAGIGIEGDQRRADPVQNGKRQRTADDTVDQIANRQALGGGVAAYTAFQQRVDCGPEVSPEHERKRSVRWHDPLGRKGHDQQHDGDARMCRPSQSGSDQDVDQRFGCDRAEQHPQARHVFIGRDHRQEVLKRDQHQTKPDPHPAEVARAVTPLRRNINTPMRMNRNETRDTSNDSTWTISVVPTLAPSMTASAGTRSTSPPAANPVTINPVAVLLWSIDVAPRPARKALNRLPRA